MRNWRFIVILSLIFELSGAAFVNRLNAEPLEFIHEHYSIEDGLPHNSLSQIYRDSRGYLWLCTWYGLSRYDGSSFVNYKMLPGDYSNLSHNRILSIEEDARGYLWILTYDYHLYRFDVSEEKFVPIPGELENFPFADSQVEKILCTEDSDVWVALSGSGLLKI